VVEGSLLVDVFALLVDVFALVTGKHVERALPKHGTSFLSADIGPGRPHPAASRPKPCCLRSLRDLVGSSRVRIGGLRT